VSPKSVATVRKNVPTGNYVANHTYRTLESTQLFKCGPVRSKRAHRVFLLNRSTCASTCRRCPLNRGLFLAVFLAFEGGLSLPVVMVADQVARAIVRMTHEVVERYPTLKELALIGIRTRGVPIARRVSSALHEIAERSVPTGVLDITLYRDDLMRHPIGPQPILRKTEIDFSIDDRRILLVDDVLYTGRTIRAALDALIDFGRPRSIELLVLVDRGHRELPIKADYVGKNLPTSIQESVQVRLHEIDGCDEVVIDAAPDR